jgi:type VI secretion system protein ImpK
VASDDDPFSVPSSEGTVMMPASGSKLGSRTALSNTPPRDTAVKAGVPNFLYEAGLNPLVAAANPLLGLAAQLRYSLTQKNPAALREQLLQEVRTFDSKAHAQGVPHETVVGARYALCTFLDEIVQSTPWGSTGIWNQQSLLVTFFNETWGGEKFFQILKKALQYPSGNRNFIELLYVCLSLGFKGRYGNIQEGHTRLEELREKVFITLRNQQGHLEPDLSPHWRGVTDKRNPLIRIVPLWVLSVISALLLLGLFVWFSLNLNQASDPVFSAMRSLKWDKLPQPSPVPATPAPPPPAVPPKPKVSTLATFLAPEVAEGLVTVSELGNKTTVRILGDTLFESGRADVNPKHLPLMARIAQALNQVQGHVVVSGHTDDRPIRSVLFPSNWHLSKQRATAVKILLAESMQDPSRLSVEGRAETDPVAPNDTPANRSRNRRVDITLMHPVGTQ